MIYYVPKIKTIQIVVLSNNFEDLENQKQRHHFKYFGLRIQKNYPRLIYQRSIQI